MKAWFNDANKYTSMKAFSFSFEASSREILILITSANPVGAVSWRWDFQHPHTSQLPYHRGDTPSDQPLSGQNVGPDRWISILMELEGQSFY